VGSRPQRRTAPTPHTRPPPHNKAKGRGTTAATGQEVAEGFDKRPRPAAPAPSRHRNHIQENQTPATQPNQQPTARPLPFLKRASYVGSADPVWSVPSETEWCPQLGSGNVDPSKAQETAKSSPQAACAPDPRDPQDHGGAAAPASFFQRRHPCPPWFLLQCGNPPDGTVTAPNPPPPCPAAAGRRIPCVLLGHRPGTTGRTLPTDDLCSDTGCTCWGAGMPGTSPLGLLPGRTRHSTASAPPPPTLHRRFPPVVPATPTAPPSSSALPPRS